jgi:hypothetical protein
MSEPTLKFRVRYRLGFPPTVVPIGAQCPRYQALEAHIPAAWTLFSAPRPINGTLSWIDPNGNGCGWFWAAVDPAGADAPMYYKALLQNDATEMRYISEEQVRREVRYYYDAGYPNHGVDVENTDVQLIWDAYLSMKNREESDYGL